MIKVSDSESIDFTLFLNGCVQGALLQLKEHHKGNAKLIDFAFNKLNAQKEILEHLAAELESGKNK